MNTMIRTLWQALALLAALGAANAALAHAVLLETDPSDGALLETAPDVMVILFNEPVNPVRAQVLDAAGNDITPADAITLDGPALRIALPTDLSVGSYIASYRVVSIDSHPIAGSIVFSVGQVSSEVAASTTPADDTGWRIAMSAARALLFAGLLGGAGGVLFLALVLPDGVRCEGRVRGTVSAFAAGGCAAAVLAMGVQGGLLLNGTAASFGEPATWRMGIGSFYGRTATAALIGLALVVIGLRTKTALRPLAWFGAAIALGGFGLSGHVVTSGPRWLTIPTLIAHTSAAAFWAGSLLPLWQVIRSNERAAPAVVERFSRLAVVAVGVLLVAGTIIAVLQVRSPGALLTTDYGLALTVKLALVAGLIALAAWNKLRLTPALGRRKASARRAMQKTIVTEMACVFAILVATGVVGTRAPPRVLAEGAAHAAHAGGSVETGLALTIIQEKRSADIVLASAWSGVNRARIALRDADGTPVEAHEVMLIASNPGAGVEPIERIAERAEDGTWRVDDLLLAPPGRWTLRLDVLINDFEKAILETRSDLLNRQPPPASGS